MGYVRFVISRNDPESGRRQGLFMALDDLYCAGRLRPEEEEPYLAIRDWFRTHLRKPRRLARASRPHAKAVALSWFKDTAVDHIQNMRRLAQILEGHGIVVDMLRSDRPGYIVYEDRFQVAAEPFHETAA